VLPRQPAVPDHFIGAAMLPQSPGVDPATCIPELVKCVEHYGFVGINLNPDPSGGHWTARRCPTAWYPIYEKMVEYDIPMIHVSTSCNALPHHRRALPERRHHGLHAMPDFGSVQGLPDAEVPDSARRRRVPYHWGRFRGLAQEMKKPLLEEHLLNNIFFDTCVYHQPGIDLLTEVIPVRTCCLPAK
jgi:4-oxalmesaconate hydratase